MVNATHEIAQEPITSPPGAPQFLVHNEGDHVGVAVQDIEPGRCEGAYMDSNRTVSVEAAEPIPLGHKVALQTLPEDSDVIEYGVRIGVTRGQVTAGQLVHTHNLRSARWQASV